MADEPNTTPATDVETPPSTKGRRGRPGGASTARRAATAQRRADAIALRLKRKSWDEIAKELGYSSKGAACKDVRRALEESLELMGERAELLRQIEIESLDRMQLALWSRVIDHSDPRAADTVLRIIDRRIKLLGLDAPTEVKVTHLDNIDEEIAKLERDLEQRRAAAGQTAEDQGTPGADR